MSKRNTPVDNGTCHGLFIRGKVLSRSLQEIPDKNIRKVVYTLDAGKGNLSVARFLPHEIEAVASEVNWPIFIRAAVLKNGSAAAYLQYDEPRQDASEEALQAALRASNQSQVHPQAGAGSTL